MMGGWEKLDEISEKETGRVYREDGDSDLTNYAQRMNSMQT